MNELPKDPRKIRERIRRYERKLRLEKQSFDAYDDSAGSRYLLGPLYLVMGDLTGALKSFEWFAKEFPDDGGEPGHRLCWALALYRSGQKEAAAQMLRKAMLLNLYLIPRLLGIEMAHLDIWYGSNWQEPDYVESIPPEYFSLWDKDALHWASDLCRNEEFKRVEARYIEIHRELLNLSSGPRRSLLVDEASRLQG